MAAAMVMVAELIEVLKTYFEGFNPGKQPTFSMMARRMQDFRSDGLARNLEHKEILFVQANTVHHN